MGVVVALKPARRRAKTTARFSPELGAHVRAIREAHGWTQEALAIRAGMRHAQLSKLEHGHNMETRWYEAVASALGYPHALALIADGARRRKPT